MLLYVIRHGETDYNIQKRLQGQLDRPLNEKGVALAKVTGEHLADVHFDVAYTSPLERARHTAALVLEASGNGQTPILDEERLLEISFGDWEGMCIAEHNYEVPMEDFYQFFRDPFVMETFPGGEHVRDVIRRTGEFLRELVRNPDLQDKTILISAHGCCSRALLNPLFEDPGDFWQGRVPYNCAVTIVEVKGDQLRILEKDRIYYDRTRASDLGRKG